MPRSRANAARTAPTCLPTRWIPPGESNSVNRPMTIAFGVCQSKGEFRKGHEWIGPAALLVLLAVERTAQSWGTDSKIRKRNLSGVSQIGIALEGNHSEVEHNTVFDTRVFDGIAVMGDRNEIADNSITHSAESGIFLQGNNN